MNVRSILLLCSLSLIIYVRCEEFDADEEFDEMSDDDADDDLDDDLDDDKAARVNVAQSRRQCRDDRRNERMESSRRYMGCLRSALSPKKRQGPMTIPEITTKPSDLLSVLPLSKPVTKPPRIVKTPRPV